MIQEALEYLFDKAEAHANRRRASILEVPGDGRSIVIEHNGTLTDRPVPPPLRSHVVRSVDDLVKYAGGLKTPYSIWIDGAKLVLVIDENDRREIVMLPLHQSAVFQVLKNLRGKITQQDLVRLLRVELRNAFNQPAILTAVRKVKFRQLSQGQSDIQHGNESLGQQIEAEVTGAGDIPDSLVVSTNVYSNPGEIENKFSIGLDLEIDAKAQNFVLRPMPDEIERIMDAALLGIRNRIEEALPDARIFFGSP